MRILSLRARHAGAPAVLLHPRLTVVIGATPDDRNSIRSSFRALVGAGPPALEAIAEIDGVSVPVDATFADTFATRATVDPIIAVPLRAEPPSAGAVDAVATDLGSAARLATLRAEQRAVSGELTLVGRALRVERSSGDVMQPAELDRRRRRVEELIAAAERDRAQPDRTQPRIAQPGVGTAPPARDDVHELAGALRRALEQNAGTDSHELARRLDDLADRRATGRARERALEQLIGECRTALASAQQMLAHDLAPELDSSRLAAVEEVREEMLDLASHPGVPSRRQRRRLEELRATESRLLAEFGHATYVSLLVTRAGSGSGGGLDAAVRAQTESRIALLEELEEFWAVQQDRLDSDRREEGRLMAEAAAVLGESAATGRARSPKLVAARLRSAPPIRLGAENPEVRLVAAQLERTLGLDPRAQRTAADVLSVAEATLRSPSVAARPLAEPFIPGPVEGGGGGAATDGGAEADLREAERLVAEGVARGERIRELEQMEQELAGRLQSVDDRIGSLERASAVLAGGEPGGTAGGVGVDLRTGGVSVMSSGVPTPPWALAEELAARRSVSIVGALPVLLEEPVPEGRVNALEGVDPLSVVAMSATNQIVWLTERGEVAAAMERVGDMASVIRI